MSLDSALARGRAVALARMTSACTIRRKSGTATVGGIKTATWTTLYTAHPIRLAGSAGSMSPSRTHDVGGVRVEVPVRVASLPHDTTDLRDGDVIEITAGDNDGLFLSVIEADWQDQSTARRVPVIGTTRPEGW